MGEGFSRTNAFDILVSAEKDPVARETLRLRAYFRILQREQPESISDYINYCIGKTKVPFSENTKDAWELAGEEARVIELGSKDGNSELHGILDRSNLEEKNWVLIGGPPCQAYSLVGRARNRGNSGYRPEEDGRHFLYKEYLQVIQRYRPAVFVMENVKGILSSTINGQRIFHSILRDLSDPDKALNDSQGRCGYRIMSLTSDAEYRANQDPAEVKSADFVIRAEKYGIPQARHRVILLGVREDILAPENSPFLIKTSSQISTQSTIGNLPPLRSKLSKEADSAEKWVNTVKMHAQTLIRKGRHEIHDALNEVINDVDSIRCAGANRYLEYDQKYSGQTGHAELNKWLRTGCLPGIWLNHETRGHISEDLRRYVYASSFAKALGYSPKGHKDFNLSILQPNHKNWKSGKFADRFRVQIADRPATTITSHISKDGHYFIHYDPSQCRSLTVREAARLQTFPDDYFFQGPRTQQYHQVGNAVPPLLAYQIAKVVINILP